jgi:hypothetical protein
MLLWRWLEFHSLNCDFWWKEVFKWTMRLHFFVSYLINFCLLQDFEDMFVYLLCLHLKALLFTFRSLIHFKWTFCACVTWDRRHILFVHLTHHYLLKDGCVKFKQWMVFEEQKAEVFQREWSQYPGNNVFKSE